MKLNLDLISLLIAACLIASFAAPGHKRVRRSFKCFHDKCKRPPPDHLLHSFVPKPLEEGLLALLEEKLPEKINEVERDESSGLTEESSEPIDKSYMRVNQTKGEEDSSTSINQGNSEDQTENYIENKENDDGINLNDEDVVKNKEEDDFDYYDTLNKDDSLNAQEKNQNMATLEEGEGDSLLTKPNTNDDNNQENDHSEESDKHELMQISSKDSSENNSQLNENSQEDVKIHQDP